MNRLDLLQVLDDLQLLGIDLHPNCIDGGLHLGDDLASVGLDDLGHRGLLLLQGGLDVVLLSLGQIALGSGLDHGNGVIGQLDHDRHWPRVLEIPCGSSAGDGLERGALHLFHQRIGLSRFIGLGDGCRNEQRQRARRSQELGASQHDVLTHCGWNQTLWALAGRRFPATTTWLRPGQAPKSRPTYQVCCP